MKHLGRGTRLGSFQPGSPAWTAARRSRIGGSEIAAVLGLSPWESYFSLWHRKAGNLGNVEDTELMLWGRLQEEPIARRFAIRHPELTVRRCGTYVNRERDYQLVTPDRVLFARDGSEWEPLEIKNAYSDEEWGPDGSDEVPIYYRCQVQWQLDAFSRPRCRMAVYFGGDEYREFLIPYDAADVTILRKRAEEFLASVRDGRLPELDGHAATYRAVRELHPGIERRDVNLTAAVALPYLAALNAEKDADEAKRCATAEVATVLGLGRRAMWNGKSIAVRVPGRNGALPYLRANPLPKSIKEIT